MDVTSNPSDSDSRYEAAQSESAATERELQGAQRPLSPEKRRRLNESRAKSLYSDEYRQMLNTTIADAAAQTVYEGSDRLPPNYVGASLWTADEKEHFFNALARYGKDNIRAIAASISTKTEVEIRAYLLLLQQGILEKNLTEPRQQMLGYTDLPAALELSQECCDALEQTAEALDMRQQRFEATAEKEKWQGLWLLTQEVGIWVEERMGGNEESLEEVAEVLPEAELLRLKTWLELSKRIFMNPAAPREHENWRSFTEEPDETPSIRYTAFLDFYTLALSITRRLVQATLFFAMSRLRSTDSKIFGRQPLVNAKDVHAATKILGIAPDSRDIWRGAARRCGLHVYRKLSGLGVGAGVVEPMSYEEIEAALGNDKTPAGRERGSRSDFVANVGCDSVIDRSSEDSALEPSPLQGTDSSEGWGTGERDTEGEGLGHTPIGSSDALEAFATSLSESDTTTYTSTKKRKTISETEHAEDLYADALDQCAGLKEEKQLWIMLKRQPPFELNHGEIELPAKPKRRRKLREDLVDWRDNVGYRPEWEIMKPGVPSEEVLEQGGEDGGFLEREKKGSQTMEDEGDGDDGSSGSS